MPVVPCGGPISQRCKVLRVASARPTGKRLPSSAVLRLRSPQKQRRLLCHCIPHGHFPAMGHIFAPSPFLLSAL
eukprot:7177046-Pyramimonas_sp.AAC.1